MLDDPFIGKLISLESIMHYSLQFRVFLNRYGVTLVPIKTRDLRPQPLIES